MATQTPQDASAIARLKSPLYILQLFRPIENFGFSYRDVRQQFTAVLRFIDLFVAEQEIDTGTEIMPATLQRIVVENVSFSYGNGRKAGAGQC